MDEGYPVFAAEKRLENRREKIPRIIRRFVRGNEPGELRNFGENMARLDGGVASLLECFLPEGAHWLVVVGGKRRDRDALILASRDGAMAKIIFPLWNLETGDA